MEVQLPLLLVCAYNGILVNNMMYWYTNNEGYLEIIKKHVRSFLVYAYRLFTIGLNIQMLWELFNIFL